MQKDIEKNSMPTFEKQVNVYLTEGEANTD